MPGTLLNTYHALLHLGLTTPQVDTVIIPFDR